MAAVPSDALKLAESLQAGGFTEQQAKTAAAAFAEAVSGAEVVTKDYLDLRLRDREQRIVIKMGGMLVVAVGVITVLVKLR